MGECPGAAAFASQKFLLLSPWSGRHAPSAATRSARRLTIFITEACASYNIGRLGKIAHPRLVTRTLYVKNNLLGTPSSASYMGSRSL